MISPSQLHANVRGIGRRVRSCRQRAITAWSCAVEVGRGGRLLGPTEFETVQIFHHYDKKR